MSIDRGMDKEMWCTTEYYSAINKNEMSFAATWRDLEITLLREVSQKRQKSYDTTYMWNLKKDTNAFIFKAETDSQT